MGKNNGQNNNLFKSSAQNLIFDMIKTGLSRKYDENYLVKVVSIQDFEPHPDLEVTRLKVAKVDGFSVIVGINEQPGKFLYFPTNSQINPTLCAYCNLYRHSEKNANPQQKGLFEDNGRVTAIKLRGQISEGFLLPYTQFHNYCVDSINEEPEIKEGTEFDIMTAPGGKEFWVAKKYIPGLSRRDRSRSSSPRTKIRGKVPKRIRKVLDTQFRFHYQTTLIKKCPHVIQPDDMISITKKVDGTSGISAYVLCKQDLNWKQKIAKWLTGEEFLRYDYIYSSRTVIKNPYYNPNAGPGYYGEGGDVWMYADQYLRPFLEKGMTFYYEIVGYLPNGKFIQKNNDFGMVPPGSTGEYKHGVNFRTMIYRITLTNVDGIVHEFSPHEVQEWCKEKGLEPVKLFYEGYARNLYPELDQSTHWTENFMSKLANDKRFNMEELEPDCISEVPAEGIVIKKDNLKSEAFKLKTFAHLNRKQKLLDKGESDIESDQDEKTEEGKI